MDFTLLLWKVCLKYTPSFICNCQSLTCKYIILEYIDMNTNPSFFTNKGTTGQRNFYSIFHDVLLHLFSVLWPAAVPDEILLKKISLQ